MNRWPRCEAKRKRLPSTACLTGKGPATVTRRQPPKSLANLPCCRFTPIESSQTAPCINEFGPSLRRCGLLSDFCSSSPSFGIGSLQIPFRGGHPGLASRFRSLRARKGLPPSRLKTCLANKRAGQTRMSTPPSPDLDFRRVGNAHQAVFFR